MIEAKCFVCGNNTACEEVPEEVAWHQGPHLICPICLANSPKETWPPHGNLPGLTRFTSDGSTAEYYELPPNARELQDLIEFRNMNAQIGEIFRACYRYGLASHSDLLRDAKKIRFYANAEVHRLETYGE